MPLFTKSPSPIQQAYENGSPQFRLSGDSQSHRSSIQAFAERMKQESKSFNDLAKFNEASQPHRLLNPGILHQEKVLGRGGFGTVYKVTDPAGNAYALKILAEADPAVLQDEIATLKELSVSPQCDPNFICYIDTFTLKWDGKEQYGIMTEFIEGTDLYNCMEKRGSNFTLTETVYVAHWLSNVLKQLHKRGYVHRDLKPENIMVKKDGSLKLIDFGISCFVHSSDKKRHSVCRGSSSGTPGYLAPEIEDKRYLKNMKKYYRTADIYAFGATLHTLLDDNVPYGYYDTEGYVYEAEYHELNTGNAHFDALIREMTDPDPERRPTAAQAAQEIQTIREELIAEGYEINAPDC